MAITYQSTRNVVYSQRNGENLIRIHPETSGAQVKLTAQNGVTAADVQAELEALHTRIGSLLVSTDAMQFKGVLNADGEIPTTHEPGWTWKIGTAGTYRGNVLEVGDMLIATVSRAGTENADSDFAAVQVNIDGAVTGPETAVDGNLAAFDQATGKIVKDSGLSTAELAKSWVMTVSELPESMPEDLKDGGILIVDSETV